LADRQIKITIRTEIQKGFGELSNQLKTLSDQLASVAQLATGLNNLSGALDKISSAAKNARDETAQNNRQISEGVRIVNQYADAQTKAGQKAEALNRAVKSGAVDSKSALQSEINLLNQLVEKTGSLNGIKGARNSKGQFANGGFSVEAIRAVEAQLRRATDEANILNAAASKPVTKNVKIAYQTITGPAFQKAISGDFSPIDKEALERLSLLKLAPTAAAQQFVDALNKAGGYEAQEIDEYGNKLVTEIDRQADRIKIAMYRLTNDSLTGFKASDRPGRQAMYNSLFGATSPTTPYRAPIAAFGLGGGSGGGGFNFGGGGGGHFSPSDPETSTLLNNIQKIGKSYTELGHLLFQLQYSTYTFFAVTGIEAISRELDHFTELQNEIARTTQKTQTLGENMKAVFDISLKTFAQPEEVGKLYSRINTYSNALGYDQKDVANTTQNLFTAISISAVNQAMKTRANTELSEILSGNQAGGRQLQALQREAPMVGQIIQQYLAQQRGMPAGSAVDLHEKGIKVDAKTVLDAFNEKRNPGVTDKFATMIAQRGRTLEDVKTVFDIEFLQYIGKLKEAFGGVQNAINHFAAWLANSDHFATFMNALGSAAVGLAAFGAALLAEAGVSAARKTVNSVVGALGRTATAITANSNIPYITNSMNLASATASRFENRASRADDLASIMRGRITSNGGNATATQLSRLETLGVIASQSRGGAASSRALAAAEAEKLGESFNKLTPGMKAAHVVVDAMSNTWRGFASGAKLAWNGLVTLVNFLSVMNFEMIVNGFKSMGAGLATFGANLLESIPKIFTAATATTVLGVAFDVLLGVLIIIPVILAILAARFNFLLNKMGDGINIFDIIKGLWDKLVDAFKSADNAMGGFVQRFFGFIDRMLGKAVDLAKQDDSIRGEQLKRIYGFKEVGSKDQNGFQNVTAFNGVQGQVRYDSSGNLVRGQNGEALAYRNGAQLLDKNGKPMQFLSSTQRQTNALPRGYSAPLPDGKDGKTTDRIGNFWRNLEEAVKAAVDASTMPPQYESLTKQLEGNVKRAVDAYKKPWEELPADVKSRVNAANETIKKSGLEHIFKEYVKSVTDAIDTINEGIAKASLAPMEAKEYDARIKALTNLTSKGLDYDKAQAFGQKNKIDAATAIRNLKAGGDLEGATKLALSLSNDKQVNQYNRELQAGVNAPHQEFAGQQNRANIALATQLELQRQSLKYFGSQRDLATQLEGIQKKYLDEYGSLDKLLADPAAVKAMNDELRLTTQLIQLQKQYNAEWTNGAKEAVGDYIDKLQDVASATKNLFSNAFQNLEDAFVSFIQTGKLNFHDFAKGIVDDLTRMFVQQKIMKPIVNAVGGLFGLDTKNPEDKILSAHRNGANIVYSKIIQAFSNVRVGGGGLDNMDLGNGSFNSNIQDMIAGNDKHLGELGNTDLGDMIDAQNSWLDRLDNVFQKNTNGGFIGRLGSIFGGVFKGIGSFIGNIFGGGGGDAGGFLSTVFTIGKTILSSFFHNGGVAGSGSSFRNIHPSVFANAQRYHSGGIAGLAPNEVPAILQRGERVLSLSEMSRGSSGGQTVFAPVISLQYNAAPSGSGSGMTNEQSQMEHAKNIQELIRNAVQKEIVEYDRRSKTPGTPEYRTKSY
jgi:lambda family phage tail tape measure protein